jgi:4-deoxy-L-threo-5-hexosulose-uronate ketol-isomerase
MANLFSLEGKNAWITGASYGIGFNIAKAFVAAGIKTIIFNDRNEETLQRGMDNYKEALYIGRGNRNVVFASADPKQPAKFYFNSATAHASYPCRKVTKQDAVVAHMGSLETSNERSINKMLVNQVLPTCQLQMGMTELAPGSVWNTMPAHVHSRRMEAYFYFELPENQAVCHFMGEPQETRHLWMQNEQAVLSPEWSIHSAAATHNYTFIWGMAGENLDYGDQDFSIITDLK